RSANTSQNNPTELQQQYADWLRTMEQLFPGAETAIREALNRFIDAWLTQMRTKGIQNPEFCSSWIPGPDWGQGSGVYQPIYLTMMHLYQQNHDFAHKMAGWLFGLILMDVVIHRDDGWECWHEARQPEDSPEGMYYRPRIALAQ